MNIILCGLPMSGKTTVGKKMAAQLDWNFIDTDEWIEQAYALQTAKTSSCRQIFLTEGEAIFRQLEKEQIARLKGSVKKVVGLGGGSLIDRENGEIIRGSGRLIYLKTQPTILWKRTQWLGIPAYLDLENPEQSFYEMAKKRMPFYEKAAHVIIETDHLNEQETTEAILWQAMPSAIFLKS